MRMRWEDGTPLVVRLSERICSPIYRANEVENNCEMKMKCLSQQEPRQLSRAEHWQSGGRAAAAAEGHPRQAGA